MKSKMLAVLAALLVISSAARASSEKANAPAAPAGSTAPAVTPPSVPAGSDTLLIAKLKALHESGDSAGVLQLAQERIKTAGPALGNDLRFWMATALVDMALAERDINKAGDAYRRALENLIAIKASDPSRLDARRGMCDIFFHTERSDLLLDEIAKLLIERPGDTKIRDLAGFYIDENFKKGNPRGAGDLLLLLVKAWPSDTALVGDLATAFLLAGDLDPAIGTFKRAATLDPEDAITAHNLGQAFIYSGKSAAAVPWFETARKGAADPGSALLDLAVAKAVTDPEASKAMFDGAREILAPKRVIAPWEGAGIEPPVRAAARKDALAQLTLVVNLKELMTVTDPKSEEFEKTVVDLEAAGYPVYTVAAIERALSVDPGLIPLLVLRAGILENMLFFGRALDDYAFAHARLAPATSAMRTRFETAIIAGEARCLVATGQAVKALEMLRNAGPREKFLFENADALIAAGRRTEGLDLLERAANDPIDDQKRIAARNRLKELTKASQ